MIRSTSPYQRTTPGCGLALSAVHLPHTYAHTTHTPEYVLWYVHERDDDVATRDLLGWIWRKLPPTNHRRNRRQMTEHLFYISIWNWYVEFCHNWNITSSRADTPPRRTGRDRFSNECSSSKIDRPPHHTGAFIHSPPIQFIPVGLVQECSGTTSDRYWVCVWHRNIIDCHQPQVAVHDVHGPDVAAHPTW